MDKASRVRLLDLQGNDIHMHMARASWIDPPTAGLSKYSRSQKHNSLKNQFELGYSEDPERFLTDSEKMLHAQRDQRVAYTLRVDEARRARKASQEFRRLQERESEFLEQVESERILREKQTGGSRANLSSVAYNIVTREGGPGYEGDLMRYEDKLVGWRKSMRALRLQAKNSRAYNVLSWQPAKPCCIPLDKPEAPQRPDPDAILGSARKPSPARPRDLLHSISKLKDVPVAATNDLQSNW